MRLFIAALAALAFLCLEGWGGLTAQAGPNADFGAKAQKLADWLADNSDFKPMRLLPVFIFLPDEKINTIPHRYAPPLPEGAVYMDTMAFYTDGFMFLQESFDIDARPDIMVHELVHHLQWEAEVLDGAKPLPCINAYEKDAYRIHREYIAQTGIGSTPNDLTLMSITSCGWQ